MHKIMRYLLSFSFIVISIFANSQSTHVNAYSSSRQRMKEDIINDFSYPYYYKRFNGKITIIDSITIRFDEKTLFVYTKNNNIRRIFEEGILYPDLFIEQNCDQFNSSLDTNFSQVDTNVIYVESKCKYSFNSLFGEDSHRISNFKSSISKISPQNRTIYFLLYRNGMINPTEYWIELYNKNATKETDMETFINGAELISIMKGSLLI